MGVMLMSSEPINKPSLPFPFPHLWSPLVCLTFSQEDKVISALLPQNTKSVWIQYLKPEFGPPVFFFLSVILLLFFFFYYSAVTVMTLRSSMWSEMTCKNGRRGFKKFGIQEVLNPTKPGAQDDYKNIPTRVALFVILPPQELWKWLRHNSDCMLLLVLFSPFSFNNLWCLTLLSSLPHPGEMSLGPESSITLASLTERSAKRPCSDWHRIPWLLPALLLSPLCY